MPRKRPAPRRSWWTASSSTTPSFIALARFLRTELKLGVPGADWEVKVPISPVIAVIPVPAASQPALQPQGGQSIASALQQAIAQTEGGRGGGGGGGGHAVRKTALDAISQIAADSAKPKVRTKSLAERQAEIERLKREQRGERDPADKREETPEQRARRNPLLALF